MRKTKARPAALLFITLAAAVCGAGRQSGERPTHRLSLPGKDWALDVALPGYKVLVEEVETDGPKYHFHAAHFPADKSLKRFASVEIRMWPATSQATGAQLRDQTIKKLADRGVVSSVKTSEHNGVAVARYRFGSQYPDRGQFIGYVSPAVRSLEAFLVRGDVWITVRLAATPLGDAEEKRFYALLDSLRFADTSAPSDSFDFYQKGRAAFLARDHRLAAEHLGRALELEQQRRALDQSQWRNMVELLIASHGAAGEGARAKELLDYGVRLDPTNPQFHLWLARLHAARGDLDSTIASLQQMFAHSDAPDTVGNRIELASNDPLHDPAFKSFHKDEKFRKAIKEMRKKKK